MAVRNPKLRLTSVLLWHDEPILFVSESTTGQSYLGLYASDAAAGAIYLHVAISPSRLTQIVSGRIGLRDAFVQGEDSVVYREVRDGLGASLEWTAVPAEKVDPTLLPTAEARVEGVVADALGARRVPILEDARQQKRGLLDLSLLLENLVRTEAPARLLGLVLARSQEVVSSIAQALSGDTTTTGKIPFETLNESSLVLYGVSSGSFKAQLALASQDLFQQAGNESLAELVELLAHAKDSGQLRTRLKRLGPRTVSRVRALLQVLAANQVGLRTEHASPSSEASVEATLDLDTAVGALAVVQEVGQELTRTHKLVGRLMGISLLSGRFELQEIEEDSRNWKGKIEESALPQAQNATINALYQAQIREEVETDPITDEEKPTYYLEALDPLAPDDVEGGGSFMLGSGVSSRSGPKPRKPRST